MVNKCVAAGCSNVSSGNISLFKFPNDPALRRQWEKQVQRTRAEWKAIEHLYLRSEHFTSDCFEADTATAATFGIKKRKRLKPDAIPTIFVRAESRPLTPTLGNDEGVAKSRKRSAATPEISQITQKREELLRKGKDLEYVNN